MPDAEGAVQTFATLTASPGAAGTSITLGPCALSLVRPEQEDERRDTASTPRGPACFGGACDQLTRVLGELDRRLSHGVRSSSWSGLLEAKAFLAGAR